MGKLMLRSYSWSHTVDLLEVNLIWIILLKNLNLKFQLRIAFDITQFSVEW